MNIWGSEAISFQDKNLKVFNFSGFAAQEVGKAQFAPKLG